MSYEYESFLRLSLCEKSLKRPFGTWRYHGYHIVMVIQIRAYEIPLIRTIPSITRDRHTGILVEDWAGRGHGPACIMMTTSVNSIQGTTSRITVAQGDQRKNRQESEHFGLDDRMAAAVGFERSTTTTTPAVARAGTTIRLDHIQTELKVDWYDKKVLDCIPAGGANERLGVRVRG